MPIQVQRNHMSLVDFMGFSHSETKLILFKNPKLFMERDTDFIQDRFDLLHNEMGYTHEILVHFSHVLSADLLTMKSRQKLLEKLGKNQSDPSKPNYVNPKAFALSTDEEFCEKVAKIPTDLYYKFLRVV